MRLQLGALPGLVGSHCRRSGLGLLLGLNRGEIVAVVAGIGSQRLLLGVDHPYLGGHRVDQITVVGHQQYRAGEASSTSSNTSCE